MAKKLTIEIPEDRKDIIDICNALLEAPGSKERIEEPEPRFWWDNCLLCDRQLEDRHVTLHDSYPFDHYALKRAILEEVERAAEEAGS